MRPGTWRFGVTGFARAGLRLSGNVAKELGNRIAGLPEVVLNALGVLPEKKLRFRVVVLTEASGENVLGVPEAEVASIVSPAISLAQQVFWREARVRLVAAGGRFVKVDGQPAPDAALRVHCELTALREDFTAAGACLDRAPHRRDPQESAVPSRRPKGVIGRPSCQHAALASGASVRGGARR